MAAKKLYDLAVKTGEYQDRASGQTKGRWQNVGAVMQGDDGGKFIMLAKWFNPAGVPDLSGRGGESILLSMFPPKDQPQAAPAPTQHQAAKSNGYAPPPQQPHVAEDEDIPF